MRSSKTALPGISRATQLINLEIEGDDISCLLQQHNPTPSECRWVWTTNAMLLKVNHLGSVTESIAARQLCQDNQWGSSSPILPLKPNQLYRRPDSVLGHRPPERLENNQLLRIEKESALEFCGKHFQQPWTLCGAYGSPSFSVSIIGCTIGISSRHFLITPCHEVFFVRLSHIHGHLTLFLPSAGTVPPCD